MADTPKHSVSVAGIVVDDHERVLVIQRRDNGQWEPPGGVLELNETPEQGVRREVLEETGLSVRVKHLSGVYKNMSLGVIALVFVCEPEEGELAISDETRSVRWLALDAAMDSMTPAYAVRLRDAWSAGAQVRSHNGRILVEQE